jgi:hypothetical protein
MTLTDFFDKLMMRNLKPKDWMHDIVSNKEYAAFKALEHAIYKNTEDYFREHPSLWYDQLTHAMEGKRTDIMLAMAEAVKDKAFIDPFVKEQILKAANRSIGK